MRQFVEYTLMDAKGATGIDKLILVDDYQHIILSVNTSNSANCTIKFAASVTENAPDFTAAQSVSNAYDFVQVKDLQDGSSIAGDTGLVLSGTDDNRLFEVNTNGIRHFTARITAYSAGNVTIKVRAYNDQ